VTKLKGTELATTQFCHSNVNRSLAASWRKVNRRLINGLTAAAAVREARDGLVSFLSNRECFCNTVSMHRAEISSYHRNTIEWHIGLVKML